MFLAMTEQRNPQLIEMARQLHQQNIILPDTYVLDVDTFVSNAQKMLKEAEKYNIELFYMTKQIGRNPYLARKLHENGMSKAVVVDFKEAQTLMDEQLPIGHIGHLVQLPKAFIDKVMDYGVDYITVYSNKMLEVINEAAQKRHQKQKVLLRVIDDGDTLYEGQHGGFEYKTLPEHLSYWKQLSNIDIAGVTSFPCVLYISEKDRFQEMPNASTLKKAQKLLQAAGFSAKTLNMPSATSSSTLKLLARLGATQGEPGHALSGTTPRHAKHLLEEKPAMVYVSEISHHFKGKSYLYGGGYYRRGHASHAKIITKELKDSYDELLPFAPDNIDYYLALSQLHPIQSTVIMAFRTQIFVTRSHVALVEGVSSGHPKMVGIYDAQGNKIEVR